MLMWPCLAGVPYRRSGFVPNVVRKWSDNTKCDLVDNTLAGRVFLWTQCINPLTSIWPSFTRQRRAYCQLKDA